MHHDVARAEPAFAGSCRVPPVVLSGIGVALLAILEIERFSRRQIGLGPKA